MRIRKLELLAATASGNFGTTLEFQEGLNIISAKNTSGKSTCIMSILYALGLEGMLGSSQQVPLPDAMCRSIMEGEKEFPVVESRVRLEIENRKQEIITVQRLVTGKNLDRQLVRCSMGPALSDSTSQYPFRDFYVRTQFAAQDESGFHRFLAEYLGYDLPNVPAFDNTSVPLYLECLMPYFFVDQLTGWRDIKSRMPTYLRVPEMAKRSAEYVLDLGILKRAIEKQQYELEQEKAKQTWSQAAVRAMDRMGEEQVLIRGLPVEPTAIWPPLPPPEVLITDGENWTPLATAINNLQVRIDQLVEEEIPKAEEVSQQVIEQLRAAEEKLVTFADRLHDSTKDLMAERAHLESVHKRLRALLEDYRQYQDYKRIEDRGGQIALETASGICPYCHQSIKDTLLDQNVAANPMSLEDNMAFIRDQIATFRDMWESAKEVVSAKEKQAAAITRRIEELNENIRALRGTLKSDGRIPSIAAVQEHLHVENRMRRLLAIQEAALEILKGFGELSKDWAKIQGKLKDLAIVGLTEKDEVKIRHLEESFVEQLRQYGFHSFPVDQVRISRESYRPSRGEYDIGLTSASDTIRIIWAYLLGMLELAHALPTNHLGLVVFDEPRQHGADRISFDALLHRAAASKNFNQQVIFATSEDQETLERIIADIDCMYRHFEDRILTRLP